MRRGWWVLGVIAIVTGCNRGPVAFEHAAGELDQHRNRVAELKVAYDPQTFDPTPDGADNAADIYRVARTALVKPDRETRAAHQEAINGLNRLGADAAAYQRYSSYRNFLLPIVQQVREAAQVERLDLGLNYEMGIVASSSELGQIRTLAKLLAAEGIYQAKAGNWEEAISILEDLFRINSHLDQEPRLQSFLVRMAGHRSAIKVSEILLNLAQNDPARIRMIQEAQALRGTLDLRRAMEGELVIQVATMRNFMANIDGTLMNAPTMAVLTGVHEDKKTMPMLAVLDQQKPEVARKALEARLLEVWGMVWPELDFDRPIEMAEKIVKTASATREKDDSYVMVRTAYSDLLTVAHGIESAKMASIALDHAIERLLGAKESAQTVEFLAKNDMKVIDQPPTGFRIVRIADRSFGPVKTNDVMLDIRPQPTVALP